VKSEEVQTGNAKPIDRQSIVAFLKWLQAQGVTFARLHVHTTRCYERNSLACGHMADGLVCLSVHTDDIISLFEQSFGQEQSIDVLQFESHSSGTLAFMEDLVTKAMSPSGSSNSDGTLLKTGSSDPKNRKVPHVAG
jgi:hypothetical protein